MFGWLQDLIDGISSAISEAFSGIGQQISQTIWSTMMTWMYDTVYSAVADFFSMMGNMGAEIFDLKWVQAISIIRKPNERWRGERISWISSAEWVNP